MTLDIEHLHSTVNCKQGFQTMVPYARSFASSIKESLKSLTEWSTYYYTSKDSWYPLPESSIHFKDMKMPVPLPTAKMIRENKEIMQEWASVNGRPVRQKKCAPRSNYGKSLYSARVFLSSGIKTH